MKMLVLLVGLSLALAGTARGQWSEPVMLGDSCYLWAGGPALVPTRGDTVWAVWKVLLRDYHKYFVGRMFTGDSWTVVERLAPDSGWYQYPEGLLDEEGRVVVSYYQGSYPVSGTDAFEDWGIYTVTRTDTGWTEPELAHEMGPGHGFPFDVRLGYDRQGGIAMTWEEGSGGAIHTGSIMLSRRTPDGWTPRRRLAEGNIGISYGGASLIPGDSTEFYLAFAGGQREPPFACTSQVWTVDDTLISGPTKFRGSGLLARTRERRYLAFKWSDSLLSSVNRGQGWEPPVVVSVGVHRYYSLAADSTGFAWLVWTDSLGQAVLASYHAGNFWTRPETVALGPGLSHVRIAADRDGRAHCSWLAPSGGLSSVHWATRLTMPGVEETMGDERGTMSRKVSIVRGSLHLPQVTRELFPMTMLDASGREAMALHPGENDVRHLSPGVYFVWASGRRRDPAGVTRVVIAR